MKKKTKISLVLSSAAAIVLAGSIMTGGTYALFTSESKTNIAVTSGKVDVVATISNLVSYSGVDLTGNAETDEIRETAVNGTFTNGGTATYAGGTLTLDKMTPGDKVTFNINIANNSNVAIKYCIKITSSNDTGLFNGLEVNIPNHSVNGDIVWKYLAYDETNTSIANIEGCSISLPSTANNDYQDKKCDITISVEAIQGNAQTEDTYYISNQAQLVDASAKTGNNRFILSDNITLTRPIFFAYGNNVLDLNTHTITYNKKGPIVSQGNSILTVKNGTVNARENALSSQDGGNLTVENVTATTTETCLFAATNATLTVNSGTFTSTDNMVVGTNGATGYGKNIVIINGGTFNANITTGGYIAVGVCFANTGTLSINGGTFNIKDGVGILARSGSTTINPGATFNFLEEKVITSGKVGDSAVQVPTGYKVVQDFQAGYGTPEVTNNDEENVSVHVLAKN